MATIPVRTWSALGADDGGEVLAQAIEQLRAEDGPADLAGTWPERLWNIVSELGAPTWSLPATLGGEECDRAALVARYARLAEGSLTAAFILTQHDASVRRLLPAQDRPRARGWLEQIADGRAFTTVGISHLTTSKRYGPHAVLARELPEGKYLLQGTIPWVTAAERATVIVSGASMEDGRQMLMALPMDLPGVKVRRAFELAALQASCTAEVACDGVIIQQDDLLAGPMVEVMSSPSAPGTGGLETSALALGQARAALVALETEAPKREDLVEPLEALAEMWEKQARELIASANGDTSAPPPAEIRRQANALALRITQAYLTARKGTGFLRADAASRWARQALFFLVWSCPAPVAQAAIRDLAGLCPA